MRLNVKHQVMFTSYLKHHAISPGSNVELLRKPQFATQTQQCSHARPFVGCSFLHDSLECLLATTL